MEFTDSPPALIRRYTSPEWLSGTVNVISAFRYTWAFWLWFGAQSKAWGQSPSEPPPPAFPLRLLMTPVARAPLNPAGRVMCAPLISCPPLPAAVRSSISQLPFTFRFARSLPL